jgi:hypothetical protein
MKEFGSKKRGRERGEAREEKGKSIRIRRGWIRKKEPLLCIRCQVFFSPVCFSPTQTHSFSSSLSKAKSQERNGNKISSSLSILAFSYSSNGILFSSSGIISFPGKKNLHVRVDLFPYV